MSKRNKQGWIVKAVCFALVLVAVNSFRNAHLDVTHYRLARPGFAPKGFRIAQISDFHSNMKLAPELVRKVKEEDPDIIALTGDFADYYDPEVRPLCALVRELSSIAPVYFVTGNHEEAIKELKPEAMAALEHGMSDAGVRFPDETGEDIGGGIRLFGIGDARIGLDGERKSKGAWHDERPFRKQEEKFGILLAHRPDVMGLYKGPDLILCGHTHGGQVRLPFAGGVFGHGTRLFPKYDAGKYEENGTVMIVSRGEGSSRLPTRVNNPPELVVVEL